MYLLMKTEGTLHKKLENWVIYLVIAFLVMWAIATFATIAFESRMLRQFRQYPWFSFFILISLLSVISLPLLIKKKSYGWGFMASMLSIVSLLSLVAIGLFPNLMTSRISPNYSLTVFNSSASIISLRMVTIISVAGAFLSGFYVTYIYKVFKGKVKIDKTSY